jgi:hypothetical protein
VGIKGEGRPMYQPNGLDRNSLQIQLDNYKLISEVNLELLDQYQVTQGELPGKLELAQSYINQSREWEEFGDQTKSHDALTSANLIIVEVGAVIKLVLNQGISSDNGSLQLDQR